MNFIQLFLFFNNAVGVVLVGNNTESCWNGHKVSSVGKPVLFTHGPPSKKHSGN